MMENRLKLNKRKVYNLPSEVLISEYRKNIKTPKFTPNLCINIWGSGLGKIIEPKSKTFEVWIKTDNESLVEFVKDFDWHSVCPSCGNSPVLNTWKIKKVILEEFYKQKVL